MEKHIWHPKFNATFSEISAGSTSMRYGPLRSKDIETLPLAIKKRKELANVIGQEFSKFILMSQPHGSDIHIVKAGAQGNADQPFQTLPDVDALMTNQAGYTLIANSADCVPVYFYDPKNKAIAVAHAGWKGTSKRIVQKVIDAMKDEYQTESKDLFIAIGPCICGQCYDISQTTDERKDLFNHFFKEEEQVLLNHEDGSISLDLKRANKVFALKMGVPEEQIEVSSICTLEDANFASYRRNPEELTNSIWSYIALAKE